MGEVDFQGKPAIRFDYNVPQMLSGYSVHTGSANAIVGYHGSFYANAQSFDMERIEVIAEDIPAELLLARAEDKIDYAITRIGEGDFLLPAQSQLTLADLGGAESQNHVKFTACRQFSGESTITFDDAPADAKPGTAPAPIREFDLPAGLDIPLEITETIDVQKIAIGDPVRTRVQRDVKRKGELILPKGATATGRITRVEKYDTYFLIGMEFPEIEGPGILARMQGDLDHTIGLAPVHIRNIVHMRTPRRTGEGVLPVTPYQLRIVRGCIMNWRS
jgi:hypothetical protein